MKAGMRSKVSKVDFEPSSLEVFVYPQHRAVVIPRLPSISASLNRSGIRYFLIALSFVPGRDEERLMVPDVYGMTIKALHDVPGRVARI